MEEEELQGEKSIDGGQAVQGQCEICGAPTADIHCRAVCPNCGDTRDCSDP